MLKGRDRGLTCALASDPGAPQESRPFPYFAGQQLPVTTSSPLVTESHPPYAGAFNTVTHCHHAPSPAAHLSAADSLKRQAGARPAPSKYEASTSHHAQHRNATCNTFTRELFARRFALWATAPLQCPSHACNAVLLVPRRYPARYPRVSTFGYHLW